MKRLESRAGYSLLEFAAILPFLLYVMLATLDVSSVLRTRSAAREALESGMRCLYPVDGNCRGYAGDAEPSPQYDWFWSKSSRTGRIPQEEYSTSPRWLELTRFRRDFEATELKRVSVPVEEFSATVEVPLYQPLTREHYVVREEMNPTVRGERPQTPELRSRFPAIPVSLSSMRTVSAHQSSSRWVELASFRVSVPRAAPDYSCYAEDPRGKPDARTCDSPIGGLRRDYYPEAVPIALWVEGRAAGGRVHVNMRLRCDEPGRPAPCRTPSGIELGTQALGGQLSGIGEANFYVRGVPRSAIPDAMAGRHPEFDDYQRVLAIPGRLMRLEFEVRPQPGAAAPVSWELVRANVYAARYTAHASPLSCANMSTEAEGDHPACVTAVSYPPQALQPATVDRAAPHDVFVASAAAETSASAALRARETLARDLPRRLAPGAPLPVDGVSVRIDKVVSSREAACPPNTGHERECPPELALEGRAAAGSPQWIAGPADVSAFTQHWKGCEPAPPLPAAIQSYAAHSERISQEDTPFVRPARLPWVEDPASDPDDPLELKKRPEFSCGAARVASLESAPTVIINKRSAMCGWQTALRERAIELHHAPPQAFFPVHAERLGYETGELPPDCCGCAGDGTGGEPGDWLPIEGGPFPENVRPPKCSEPDVSCRAALRIESIAGSVPEEFVNQERALRAVQSALAANLPWAKMNCGGAGCVAARFAHGEACGAKGAGTFCGTVDVSVPLYALLGRPLQVRLRAQERSERELAK